jgi:hypothetical protein
VREDLLVSTRTGWILRALAGGIAAAALGFAPPEAASAHDDHRHHRKHGHPKHHKHKHHGYGHGYGYGHGHGAPYYGGVALGYGYPVHVHGPACGHGVAVQAFYCEPCGHRFGSLHALHGHVHHHHHVPTWQLPYVVIQASFGWVFGG